jgi:quercetin dioxygenase-like cupin family protein
MTPSRQSDTTPGTRQDAAVGRAFAWAPGDGDRIDIGTATFLVRASAESTRGALTIFEEEPPLLDTPSHVHRAMDETFYVLDGEHEFICGAETFHLGPGGVAFLPRGIPHAHRRLVPGVGRLMCITTPGGFEGFFRILADAARSG